MWETYIAHRDVNPILLTRIGLRTSGEFKSPISNNDYSYFFCLLDEGHRGKLDDFAHSGRRASAILAFGFV